jgi:hypothetical protein
VENDLEMTVGLTIKSASFESNSRLRLEFVGGKSAIIHVVPAHAGCDKTPENTLDVVYYGAEKH